MESIYINSSNGYLDKELAKLKELVKSLEKRIEVLEKNNK